MSNHWQPGQSGNPKGRPPGSGEVAKMRAAIAERLPDVIDVLVQKALSGDISAARLLLERTVPPLRAQELPLSLSMPTSGSFTDQGRSVLQSIASEEIEPSRGAALITAIATLARITEIDELTARIATLETRLENRLEKR